MVKRHTSLSVDSDLMDKAKEKELNISELTENAIKEKLGETEVVIEEATRCELCGREGREGTADDFKHDTNTKDKVENPTILTWLYPDEKWVCNACMREKSKVAQVAQK